MTKEEYFGDWSRVIDVNEADRILKSLPPSSLLLPHSLKDIFLPFHQCPLTSLRVVIIGNSPLTFYPPSLDILKESVIDFTIPHRIINFDASLEKWRTQGVLVLGSVLSCEKGRVEAHKHIWKPFIKSLLTNLSCYHTGIVYILMGTEAQGLEPYINRQFNHIVRIRQPSWYAAHRTRMPSDIWKEINQLLIGLNGYGIKWYEEY